MLKSVLAKAAVASLTVSAFAGSAMAQIAGGWRTVQTAPEIDGPAGVAAVALLVSAGIMAYNRLRK